MVSLFFIWKLNLQSATMWVIRQNKQCTGYELYLVAGDCTCNTRDSQTRAVHTNDSLFFAADKNNDNAKLTSYTLKPATALAIRAAAVKPRPVAGGGAGGGSSPPRNFQT